MLVLKTSFFSLNNNEKQLKECFSYFCCISNMETIVKFWFNELLDPSFTQEAEYFIVNFIIENSFERHIPLFHCMRSNQEISYLNFIIK